MCSKFKHSHRRRPFSSLSERNTLSSASFLFYVAPAGPARIVGLGPQIQTVHPAVAKMSRHAVYFRV